MSDNVGVPEFGRFRRIFFPIHGFEVKKALPMGMMFFFILLCVVLLSVIILLEKVETNHHNYNKLR